MVTEEPENEPSRPPRRSRERTGRFASFEELEELKRMAELGKEFLAMEAEGKAWDLVGMWGSGIVVLGFLGRGVLTMIGLMGPVHGYMADFWLGVAFTVFLLAWGSSANRKERAERRQGLR